MKERIITALVLIVVIFTGIVYSSEYVFGVGAFAVAMLGATEWIKFADVNDEDFTKYLSGFVGFALVTAMALKFVLIVFVVFWFYAAFKLYQYEKEKINSLSKGQILMCGAFALSPFAACLYVLHDAGIAWVFLFILVVAGADSGAYFTGKAIGKNKMLPRLSPKKTIEGLLGGFVCAVAIALVFLMFMDLDFVKYIAMSVVCGLVAVVSVMGDVFESMMKRVAGVKDSGNVLPGHGGVLDRVDGYLPALPLFVLLGYVLGVFTL